MADFATEIDLLKRDTTFQIVVAGITGIPGEKVVGIITDDLDISGGNQFHNTLQSSAVNQLQETISKFQSIAEKVAYFSKVKEMVNDFSVRTVEQGLDFWTNSERPTFKQSMIFVAQKEDEDIRIPVANLYKTVFPKLKGFGFTDTVIPPLNYVPYSASDTQSVRGTISVSIGRWFAAQQQVMKSVSFKFSKECTSRGLPLFAVGEISFHPFREISWKEMCAYMGVSVNE